MTTITEQEVASQLEHLRLTGFDKLLTAAANAFGLPVAFVYAVASRETNCRNVLGDFRSDGAHGVGIMQIDIQWPAARQMRDDGTWQTNPARLITIGCEMLRNNLHDAQQDFSNQTIQQQLQAAADGYNAGMRREIARECPIDAPDDSITTGGNYGSDVIARMAMFSAQGGTS